MQRLSRLEEKERNEIFKYFTNDITASRASEMAEVSRNTVNKWYRSFRELIMESMVHAPRFKGIVELDQAFFGRRRRKKRKRRVVHGTNYGMMGIGFKPGYIKNRTKSEDLIQVFGIIERKKGGGSNVYVQIVRNARRDTLIPIIHMIVEEKSMVFTDSHRTFDLIGIDGYKHGVINKVTRTVFWSGSRFPRKAGRYVHVQNIESFWGFAKDRLRKFKGVPRSTYPLHIKESAWRWNNRGSKNVAAALKRLLDPSPSGNRSV